LSTPITKVLVANRGEIARRIFRTCRALGLRSVAVYSDADVDMPFTAEADEAINIGPPEATESYLSSDRILEAARRAGADAIHPGYGFLSENAAFAEACGQAGFVFIGPSPEAIQAMGAKQHAKRCVAEAGVPVVPGSLCEDQSEEALVRDADSLGYPLLVKASAGGGGKGMRVVEKASQLGDAIASAKREAAAAFGDDTLILERYVDRPRHIEVQIIGDEAGNLIHLGERECSVQRRHQKVIEEAPSPAVDAALRKKLGQAALNAARAIGYRNAGTVEFILSPEGEFYFLEMNTRLQVEHPVTEEITGIDLVALQIRVAAGLPLGLTQEDVTFGGHAIECRLYAEDPNNAFLPATGTLRAWHIEGGLGEGLRLDSGVDSGDEISVHYDPMIAKVIAHGPDRETARRRLVRALESMLLAGVTTNRAFLVQVLTHPAFVSGDLDTHFIDRHRAELTPAPEPTLVIEAAIAATIAGFESRRMKRRHLPELEPGFRNVFNAAQRVEFRYADQQLVIEYRRRAAGHFDVWAAAAGDSQSPAPEPCAVHVLASEAPRLDLEIGGHRRRYTLIRHEERVWVHTMDAAVELEELPRFARSKAAEVSGGCVAPMHGKIIAVEVTPGDTVSEGDTLVVMEAMKMEHAIVAGSAGVVSEVCVDVGDQVDDAAVLIIVLPED